VNVALLDELGKTGAKIAIWNRQVSSAAIERARLRGLQMWIYTVNEPKLVRRLLDTGVAGIITNEVSLIQATIQPRQRTAKT
jgi:glycerophosphoryl diester phosphodiesterase